MEATSFFKRKNIEISAKRYGIDALGAMAQGLFCSLLIGTIIKTLGTQLGIQYLTDIGTYAMAVSGPAMAVAIGYALKADPMVLYSMAAVGWAANAEGGAGGPLAVLIIAIVSAECGKMVSKETKIDILVTPGVTILVGVALAKLIAPPIGTAASAFGTVIDNATKLQPFWMGIAVSVLVGIALTLPISWDSPVWRAARRSPAAARRWLDLRSCPLRRTSGAVWCPRVWAPPCCRCPTSSAIPGSGSRQPWLPPLPDPLPHAFSGCR